jgi:hypothetical protein
MLSGNPTDTIADVGSLILKQVVNPASQAATVTGLLKQVVNPASQTTTATIPLQKVAASPAATATGALVGPPIPPYLYTLTLTKYGDDSALFVGLTPGNSDVSLVVNFHGLKPDSYGVTDYSVTLSNLQKVRCLTEPGLMDEDFDSIDDIGMEKITMTFTSADFESLDPASSAVAGSSPIGL